MRPYLLTATTLLAAAAVCFSARSPEILFERHTIDLGVSETCAIADFNNDGRPDIFSGDAWYENPTWKKHEVRHLKEYGTYLESLSDLPLDVDGDGLVDIVSSGWHSGKIWWSRNPGKPGGLWQDHLIDEGYPVEFSFLVDLDNDGKAREVLPQFGNLAAPTAWYEAVGGTFRKHVVSPVSYGHGIGAGDVNGDGRNDIITPQGWFEAPPDPRAGEWKWHPDFDLGDTGFIYVYDVNGDGRNDIVTSMAHNYGIFWLEQGADGKWTKHIIDESWSQAHAMTLVDLNGDGQMDLLTGKRYMAHNGHDPGEREPLGIYWYEFMRLDGGKKIEWVKHVIDYSTRTGGGMQIPVADLNGDGDLDFVVAGKSGLFLFENLTKH